jgi:HK97 family phage prohead protease
MTMDFKNIDPNELRYKTVVIQQVKAKSNTKNGGFEGYGSAFGVEDSYGEITEQGCFAKHLQAFIDEGWIAEGHDWRKMGVGFPLSAREDNYGLFFDMEFHGDAGSQAIRQKVNERIEAKKAVKLSIGYYLRGWRVEEDPITKKQRFILTEVELKEISIVNVPANPGADVTASKSVNFSDLPYEEHGKLCHTVLSTFHTRTKERVENRTDRKAGSELSQQNVAIIDQALGAIDLLNEVKEPLKELADRNRKSAESTDTSTTPETSVTLSQDDLAFHRRNIELLHMTLKDAA